MVCCCENRYRRFHCATFNGAFKPVLTLPASSHSSLPHSDVVQCEGCGAVYVGTTSQPLKRRIQEHQKGVRLGLDNISAVAKHCMDIAHPIDWGYVSILDFATAFQERLCKGSVHIIRKPQAMNLGYPMLWIWQPVIVKIE